MPMDRYDGLLSFLVSLLLQFLINLIMGLVAVLFVFGYELARIAWEYQTPLVSLYLRI